MFERMGLIATVALGLAGSAHAATVQPYSDTAFTAAQQANAPILIDVTAPWCPTCARQHPILAKLYDTPEFAGLQVFTVDFDSSKPLLQTLGVQTQSTLIAYHGKTEEVRATGITSETAIHDLLARTAG